MTRILFDTGIFSVIDEASAIGIGWQLSFYTANTTTRIITYTTAAGSTQNTNPVLSDAEGRFPETWIEDGQSIKWALADDDGTIITTIDDYLIAASPPSFDPALDDFLAGDAPLPLANGGTASTSAVNALAALGAMGLVGGTFTGQIKQTSAGAYLYNGAAGQVQGGVFVTIDSDPDPTTLAGQWWARYA
jgi:hypothetical protein